MKTIMIGSLLFLGSFGVANATIYPRFVPPCPSDATYWSLLYQGSETLEFCGVLEVTGMDIPDGTSGTAILTYFYGDASPIYSRDWFISSSPYLLGAPIGLGSLQSAVGITTTNIVGFAAIPIALFVVFWIIGQLIGLFPGYKETVVKPQKVGKTIKL